MAALELRLLGGFEARLNGGPAVDLPTRKARLLLGFLALPPGQVHPREKLASLLWSDRPDAQAQHSLRQSLSSLRKALAEAEGQPLVADRRAVSLDPAAVAVDAVAFEELLDSGTVEALRRACGLYRGELLAGESARDRPFEDWLFYERGRRHDLALQAFEGLLSHQRAAGETEAATETAQRLIALSPVHEKAHRALMALYADQGRRAAALEQYRHCRAVLERELAVVPGPETEALHREILEGRGRQSAAETAPEAAPRPPRPAAPALVLASADAPEGKALPLPEKPSVAVLPFVNMSGDAGQDYLCDGITEDIITELSRFRSLFVTARHSSFAFRGRSEDLRAVGRALGVQHLVEGSVQRAGNRIRVTAQLIDAASGHHVWAERYDRDLEDIFAVQEDVAGCIAGHVTARIDDQRLEAARQHPESLQAYDYWLQAKPHLEARNPAGIAEGRRLLERALEIDPRFARAYAYLAASHVFEAHYVAGGTAMRDKIDQTFRLARTAVSLDGGDARTLALLGQAHMFRREFQHAAKQFDLAAKLNPSDADALMLIALGRTYSGDPASGIELNDKAVRLNPYHPYWYRLYLAWIYLLARRPKDAFRLVQDLSDPLPDVPAWKAAVCVRANRLDEARALVDRFIQNVRMIWVGESPPGPDAFRHYFLNANPIRREDDAEWVVDSLRKAGLPG